VNDNVLEIGLGTTLHSHSPETQHNDNVLEMGLGTTLIHMALKHSVMTMS
jgi:hypothetical protein